MPRTWTNDSGLALSASNMNALEADVVTALGVPNAALKTRLEEAGDSKTYLDGRYATITALNGKEPAFGTGTVDQYLRGDKTWADMPAAGGGGVQTVNTLAELQAAALVGGVIHVGDEVINSTATVNITVPVWIIGGRFQLPEDATYPVFNVTSSNVSFLLTSFNGAGTTAEYAIDARFILATGNSTTPLENVNVIGATMTGSQTENIRYVWVRYSTISESFMDDFLYAGVLLLSCSDMTVSECHITNAVMKAPVVNVYGIAATDTANTVAGRSRNIKIANNTVKNIPWEGIDTHGGDGIVITGNTVIACSRGIALVVGSETRTTVPINCVVTGNFIDKSTFAGTEREAISLFGLTGNLANAIITGNRILGYSAANSMFVNTAYVDPLKTLVEGNSHPHIPWTNLVMENTPQWTADATFIPQYMVDGRTVYLRGFVKAVTSATTNSKISTMPAVARPTRLTFAGASHGSNSAAGTGTLGVYETGELWMLYRTGADLYSYPIECSYQRNFTG